MSDEQGGVERTGAGGFEGVALIRPCRLVERKSVEEGRCSIRVCPSRVGVAGVDGPIRGPIRLSHPGAQPP